MQNCKATIVYLGLCAAVAITLVVVSGHYIERHTTKIDDVVSLVTLDEHVIALKRGLAPRVTRVRPAVTPPKMLTEWEAVKSKAPATIKWTLPYSCSDVRYYNSHFTLTQLDAMRQAAGMALPTADQRAQIQACLTGRIK